MHGTETNISPSECIRSNNTDRSKHLSLQLLNYPILILNQRAISLRAWTQSLLQQKNSISHRFLFLNKLYAIISKTNSRVFDRCPRPAPIPKAGLFITSRRKIHEMSINISHACRRFTTGLFNVYGTEESHRIAQLSTFRNCSSLQQLSIYRTSAMSFTANHMEYVLYLFVTRYDEFRIAEKFSLIVSIVPYLFVNF